MSLTAAQLRKIALSFLGTSEGASYGKPSFLVGKKSFTRLRAEDNSLVVIVGSIDERDMLLEADPKRYHITEHYRDWPTVLVRMWEADASSVRAMLERRWREIAGKQAVKAYDAKTKG